MLYYPEVLLLTGKLSMKILCLNCLKQFNQTFLFVFIDFSYLHCNHSRIPVKSKSSFRIRYWDGKHWPKHNFVFVSPFHFFLTILSELKVSQLYSYLMPQCIYIPNINGMWLICLKNLLPAVNFYYQGRHILRVRRRFTCDIILYIYSKKVRTNTPN